MGVQQEISITRALTELKVTKERLANFFNEPRLFITALQGVNEHVVDHGVDKTTVERRMQSDYDSFQSLITKQERLKAAIVASNATTIVKIAGKEITVAAAIELRATLAPKEALLKAFKAQYTNNSNKVAKVNAEIEANVKKHQEDLAKQENNDNEATRALLENYRALNDNRLKLKVHDYLKLEDKIKALEAEILEIKTELDYVLSESNTRTLITVEV